MEQISLFDESEAQVNFHGHYCNDDWTMKTNSKNIVDTICFRLTKKELKEICRKAVDISKQGPYTYQVNFIDHGCKKAIDVRFVNYTVSTKRTVFEHIDLYFDCST